MSSLQPTDYEHLASVQVSHEPLRLGTLRETAHAGCHPRCLVLVGLEAKFLEEDAYMKTRNIMYGLESKPIYGDEDEIKIEAYLPNKHYRGQLPSDVSVSLDPTRVEEDDVRVIRTTLKTTFSIEALDSHRSLITRASLGADTSSNLNHAESVARYWLKECLENHEICVAEHKQRQNMPLRIIEIEGDGIF